MTRTESKDLQDRLTDLTAEYGIAAILHSLLGLAMERLGTGVQPSYVKEWGYAVQALTKAIHILARAAQ